MRGGRNKFGPMYKRDRARKLQIMRQRQLALQTLRAAEGGGNLSQLSPTGYPQSYSHMNIKQEIQIPQVSLVTIIGARFFRFSRIYFGLFSYILSFFCVFLPDAAVNLFDRFHRYHR